MTNEHLSPHRDPDAVGSAPPPPPAEPGLLEPGLPEPGLPEPERAAPAASAPVIEERMHPLSPLVHLWVGVVALAWFVLMSVVQGEPIWNDLGRVREMIANGPWWMYAAAAAVVIGLVSSYWGWWTTKFVIDDREFRLENTGAFQESKRIAFSRIQAVDVSQPFAARLLGLAQVKIDVGSDGGATLSFLKRSRATQVRDYLMARAHGRAASTTDTLREASAWDDSAAGDEILIRLTPADIILSAVVSIELPLLVLGFVVPVVLGQLFDWSIAAVGGGFVPLAIALFSYLSRRLVTQFNYTLARTPSGLRITRGLTTLRSQTLPAHRVQSLQISQPIMWRLLNRARLDVTVLGLGDLGGGEELSTKTLYLPIGTPAQVQLAIAALWPGLQLEKLRFTGASPRARWLNPFEFSWMGHALDNDVIVIRSGFAQRSQLIVPHSRVQAVSLSDGPLERRLGLASVDVQTTDLLGASTIAHLDAPVARRLAFDQLDRARATRTDELLDPPDLRSVPLPDGEHGLVIAVPDAEAPVAPVPDASDADAPAAPAPVLEPPASEPIDLWLPPTAPLPSALPPAPPAHR